MPRYGIPSASPSADGLMAAADKLTLSDLTLSVINSVPTTGQTVSFRNRRNNQLAYIAPAGTLAALTIAIPSDTASRIGQVIEFTCTQIITALTLSTVSGSAPTFLKGGGALSALVAGDTYRLTKVAALTWAIK